MTPPAESRFESLIVAYARWLVANRWRVVALSLAVVAAMVFGARHMQFSTDFRVYFGPDNPQLQAFNEMQNVYTKTDTTFFAVSAKDGGTVFRPRLLEAIRELTRESWKLPYAIRVDSVTNYQHTEANGDDLKVGALLPDGAPLDTDAIAHVRRIALADRVLLNRLLSPDGTVTGVNMTAQLPQQSPQELPATVHAARELRDRILAKYPEVEIHLTGGNLMSNAFNEAAMQDMQRLVPLMYLVIFGVMWLMLRSGWATTATLLVVAFASASAMGLAGYIGIQLTPPVAVAPMVVTVLAVADCVHIALTMFTLMRGGMAQHAAIVESMRLNFVPVFLTSATTSICFLGTNFTDSPPLTALGNICSMGGMLCWALAIFLLPALLALVPVTVPKERKAAWITRSMDRLAEFVLRHRRAVFFVSLAVVAALTALAPRNEANDKFAHFFGRGIAFRDDTDFIVDRLTGIYSMEFSLKSGESNGVSDPGYLRRLEQFEQWWRTGPYAGKVMYLGTVTDVFRKLNQAMHGDDPAWHRLPEDRDLAAQYLLLYEMSLPFGLDLNNLVNIDKSSSRFVVIFRHLKSRETREIEQAAYAWLQHNEPGMETRGVGPGVMFAYISERNIQSNFLSLPFSIGAISLLLLPGLRSWKFGLLSLIPNLLPLGMAFGIWALWSGEINFTMAVVLNTVIGIIVDDTIHFFDKYLRARRELQQDPEDAVRYAFHEAGAAMVVTTLILALGFLVLAQSAFLPNSSLALLTAITIAVAMPLDLLFTPTLVLLVEGRFGRSPAPVLAGEAP
ncbi:MAG TPA: MMPL family transporter [Candidatus Binatia bacterium]|nr:MMPL family transporter [Candidatus Binatia bacterium]